MYKINHIQPVIANVFGNSSFIFQDDNATITVLNKQLHGKKTQKNGVQKFNWSTQSQDLNIIEKCPALFQNNLSLELENIENRNDIVSAVTRILNGLSQTYIMSYFICLDSLQRTAGYNSKRLCSKIIKENCQQITFITF